MLRLFISSLLLLSLDAAETIDAPNSEAKPIDQRLIAENSCGPVSLLNAYRFSSADWRAMLKKLPTSANQQFNYFTKYHCRRFSKNAYMRRRWTAKIGIRPDDLTEAINEFHNKVNLPRLTLHSLFHTKEYKEQQVQRTHQAIVHSLKSGFPPILHIARYGKIYSDRGFRWSIIVSHYVIITQVPAKLSDTQPGFRFTYADSADGYLKNGELRLPKKKYFANDITSKKDQSMKQSPCLVADLLHSSIGENLVQPGSPSALIATHLIGATSAP